MQLETEFQLHLQRRLLEQALKQKADSHLDRSPLAPSGWVKLLQPLSLLSADEALLLCQYSEHQWLAWVPEYGEILLDTDQFYGWAE
ncbi:hypothetical protein [Pantanalinema sp. GBBB05]|uniref:hypothetical protein n=1 Tax=Pantanalinema sp. GBBB05 TaxID=2604139 RepID=UPI003D81692E